MVSGKSVGGLYNFIQALGTEKMLATMNNAGATGTELYYRSNGAGAWTALGITATWNVIGQSVEMQGFLGYCFFVGYNATANTWLPVGSLTGTTFSTATNVTNMPQGKFIVRYRDRLYVLNCYTGATAYPFRVYFSSVPSAGAITWDVSGSSTQFFDVDYDLYITGAGVNWDKMVIFTEYAAYLYDQSQLKLTWATGCSNHRTICTSGAYMIWANMDGVWLSTGGQPQNISGEVIDFIRNGNPRNFFAKIVDEVYHLYVGTVTVNGVTYVNCTLKFNIAISTWEWREYADNMAAYAVYNSTGTRRLYMGDTSGQVWDKGKYTDTTLVSGDSQTTAGVGGIPIGVTIELSPVVFEGSIVPGVGGMGMMYYRPALDSIKQIKQLMVYADRAQSVKVKIRILDKNTRILTPYKPIGELVNFVNNFQVNISSGAILQVELTENSTLPYFSVYGYAIDIERDGDVPRKSLK